MVGGDIGDADELEDDEPTEEEELEDELFELEDELELDEETGITHESLAEYADCQSNTSRDLTCT